MGTDNGANDEEPLDPRLEAMRLRLMRLLVSGLVVALGFAAIVVAAVYRFGGDGDSPAVEAPVVARDVDVRLPAGARVIGTAVSDRRLALTLQMPDGRTVIHVVDTAGRPVVRYRLETR